MPTAVLASLFPALAPPRSALPSSLREAPRLGLGLAALGRPGYINLGHHSDLAHTATDQEAMQAHTHAVLDEAYALGIRYFDCARSYGLSEAFLGSWLSSRADDAGVVVGSKWGYEYTAGWRVSVDEGEAHEVKEHTRAQLERQLAQTRDLLPSLDLYQIHSATQESAVLDSQEVLDTLAELREAGCAVGLSVSHPQTPTIIQATAITHGGRPLFASVQATFNLLDQSAADALLAASQAGMVVIVKEALANGRLTSRAPPSAGLDLLKREAEALGTSVDALALAWVLSHPWVDVCLSGATTVQQLRSNVEAIRLAPLEPELRDRLAAGLSQDCEAYWAERKTLSWN